MKYYDFQVNDEYDILFTHRYYAKNAEHAFCQFLADMLNNAEHILANRQDVNSADYAERVLHLFLTDCYSIEDDLGDTVCIDFDI